MKDSLRGQHQKQKTTTEASETSTESRRSRQIEQEVQTVQEKLFARLDRRSVCGQEGTARENTLVQDRRMGRYNRGRDVLRPRFAKSDSGR